LSRAVRLRILTTLLRWLAVLLILRVLFTILANYPDYLPPNFASLFLQGREQSFFSPGYQFAFYIHITTSPIVLLNGLILLSDSLRRRYRTVHRVLGRVQVVLLLFLMLPSSMVMARHSFAGWASGASFLLLAVVTATCAVVGVIQARRHRYDAHRRWMLRCFVLICSAVALRLISGAASLLGLANPEQAYIIAAWCSWMLPLAILEIALRRSQQSHPFFLLPPISNN
jgi:uncharacterized membrane protein